MVKALTLDLESLIKARFCCLPAVTLGKRLNVSLPPFSHLWKGASARTVMRTKAVSACSACKRRAGCGGDRTGQDRAVRGKSRATVQRQLAGCMPPTALVTLSGAGLAWMPEQAAVPLPLSHLLALPTLSPLAVSLPQACG